MSKLLTGGLEIRLKYFFCEINHRSCIASIRFWYLFYKIRGLLCWGKYKNLKDSMHGIWDNYREKNKIILFHECPFKQNEKVSKIQVCTVYWPDGEVSGEILLTMLHHRYKKMLIVICFACILPHYLYCETSNFLTDVNVLFTPPAPAL